MTIFFITTRHTTPAVKRKRAAVDGLDPDSPRVKRIFGAEGALQS